MVSLLSVLAALVASAAILSATGWVIYLSEFSEGMIRLQSMELDQSELEQVWASGYRLQWFIIFGLPLLHGALVAWGQRRIAPSSSYWLALLATVPGGFALMLTNLLVFYTWSAILSVGLSFLGLLVGTRKMQSRV